MNEYGKQLNKMSLNSKILQISKLLKDIKKYPEAKEKLWDKINLWQRNINTSKVEVQSIFPLSTLELKQIKESLEYVTGKPAIKINNIITPELIGGLKIIFNNKVYDASLLGQLDFLTSNFRNSIRS